MSPHPLSSVRLNVAYLTDIKTIRLAQRFRLMIKNRADTSKACTLRDEYCGDISLISYKSILGFIYCN